MLELGKLESQKKVFKLDEIDFKPNLAKICNDFETLSKLENIKFSYELVGENYFIKAQVSHLENAISNLLDNAQKYSEEPIIDLKAFINKDRLFIAVSDNGIGIDNNEKELIFKKYYRVANGNVHKVKGYGLGLSYVKEVIKKHKGKISVESQPGYTTTFEINIPLSNAK